MTKRSVVFPKPRVLVGYARKAGITVNELWRIIETELEKQPSTRKIVVRGPKKAVTIELKRDSIIVKKRIFDGVELYNQRLGERAEDAAEASELTGEYSVDANNVSDMSPAAKKGHNRTPWPLMPTEAKKVRYPIPARKPNPFDNLMPDDFLEKRKLFYRTWAEANRFRNLPSWLVRDYENRFVVDILEWLYPKLLTSEKQKRQAAITLEAINVHLWGREPSENSPLQLLKDKSIARRVQRFLEDAEEWWQLHALAAEAEAAYDRAEAAAYFGNKEEHDEDDVAALWKKRLADNE